MAYHRKGKVLLSVDNSKAEIQTQTMDGPNSGELPRPIVNRNASLFEMMESADKKARDKGIRAYMGNL